MAMQRRRSQQDSELHQESVTSDLTQDNERQLLPPTHKINRVPTILISTSKHYLLCIAVVPWIFYYHILITS